MSDGEVPLPKLNEPAARGLDSMTRGAIAIGQEGVKLTFLSQSWRELGFASFEAWAGSFPKWQLSRDERKLLVTELDGLGMTQRQIAAAVGVDQSTVNRDLADDANASEPEPVRAEAEALDDANASDEPSDQSLTTPALAPDEKVAFEPPSVAPEVPGPATKPPFMPEPVPTPELDEDIRLLRMHRLPDGHSFPGDFDPTLLSRGATDSIRGTQEMWRRWCNEWDAALAAVPTMRRVK